MEQVCKGWFTSREKKTERLHLVMKVSRIDTNDEILERETFISSI